ncbi:hypothetical protein TIFTF001_039866 [Ficus carica]|uniref:Uncharacterized protein n=1 Tax=Ficus carica TaxID=3494 RepID=A0AA87YVG7_FICCA|nr:hypothetical protein TIFTF001_039866 [Ficus carica]
MVTKRYGILFGSDNLVLACVWRAVNCVFRDLIYASFSTNNLFEKELALASLISSRTASTGLTFLVVPSDSIAFELYTFGCYDSVPSMEVDDWSGRKVNLEVLLVGISEVMEAFLYGHLGNHANQQELSVQRFLELLFKLSVWDDLLRTDLRVIPLGIFYAVWAEAHIPITVTCMGFMGILRCAVSLERYYQELLPVS